MPLSRRLVPQLACLSKCYATAMLACARELLPVLADDMHKGSCGRVVVFGGSVEYTGAPYFAAISALKAGCDLSHVISSADAAPIIKTYSPELIVLPFLHSDATNMNRMAGWLDRMHAAAIGPGMGRPSELLDGDGAQRLFALVRDRRLPLVVDAVRRAAQSSCGADARLQDGLFFVTESPRLVGGYSNALLTPNCVEFERLYRKVLREEPPPTADDEGAAVKRLAKEMGGVTIVRKGRRDHISDGNHVLVCDVAGSRRRCGGQGDVLSGAATAFSHFAHATALRPHSREFEQYGACMVAAYAACALTRHCGRLAFDLHGRATTTSDMINQIDKAIALFEPM